MIQLTAMAPQGLDYRLRVTMWHEQAVGQPCKLEVYEHLDLGELVSVAEVILGTSLSTQLKFSWAQRDDGTNY